MTLNRRNFLGGLAAVGAAAGFSTRPASAGKKNRTGTLKKGFSVVMDEVEPFDFFIEKK